MSKMGPLGLDNVKITYSTSMLIRPLLDTTFRTGDRIIQNDRLSKVTLLDMKQQKAAMIIRKCSYYAQMKLSFLYSSNLYLGMNRNSFKQRLLLLVKLVEHSLIKVLVFTWTLKVPSCTLQLETIYSSKIIFTFADIINSLPTDAEFIHYF